MAKKKAAASKTQKTVDLESAGPDPKMQVWDSFCHTPVEAQKAFTRAGGFKGTAINSTYIMLRLTQRFGPCGLGWRFVIDDERYVAGRRIEQQEQFETIHVVRGHLEYRIPADDGKPILPHSPDTSSWISTGPQFGQTTFVGTYKDGRTYTDEEAPKKSVTDCLGKCAAQLGIGADILLGPGGWNDNKYAAPSDDASGKPAGKPAATTSSKNGAAVKMEDMHADQWAERLTKCDAADKLCTVFEKLLGKHKHGKREWNKICQVFADRCVELPDGPGKEDLIGMLQVEKEKLTAK